MIKATINFAGSDPARMISDGTTVSIEVDGSQIYSETPLDYPTAQEFIETINTLPEFSAELQEGYTFQVSSIMIGTWDLSASAELGIYPLSILSPYALMSWEQAKILINASEDERLNLETLINSVSLVAERDYAKRPLKKRLITQIVDGNDSTMLDLDTYPVESIQCWIDKNRLFGPGTEAEVLLYENIGLIKRPFGFPVGMKNVKLIYLAGYDPVPEDLVTACAESVAYLRGRLQQNGAGIRSMTAPNGINTTYELTFPMNAQRVFESYAK